MGVTIRDIADASGVSKATVSYILNNKTSSVRLSPQTIRRVLDVCAEMHYSPSKVAQALSFQRRADLSLLVLSPWLYAQHSDFMAIFNRTIEKAAATRKLATTFERFSPGELSKTLKIAQCGKYNAVLFIGTDVSDERFLARNQEKLSGAILLNRQIPGMLSCRGDDRGGCEKLGAMIAAGGFYRKYVIAHHATPSRREKLRTDGFLAGLKSVLKRSESTEKIALAEMGDDGDLPAQCGALLDRYSETGTVFLFTTHLQAAHMMTEAHKRRLEIPEEVGVVGFDRNSILDDFLFPEMTTIDPRIDLMTQKALELAEKIKSGDKGEDVVVEAEIVEGGSCLLGTVHFNEKNVHGNAAVTPRARK